MKFVVAFVLAVVTNAASLRRSDSVTVDQGSVSAYEAAQRDDEKFLQKSWQQLAEELKNVSGTPVKMDHTVDKANAAKMRQVMDATKGLMGKAMLAPALGMLHGLYDDQKGRISSLNKREQKSKDRFAEQQKKHDEKVASLKDKLDHHKISKEFFDNSTKDENRLFKYWQSCRERAHHQFHTQLKLTHGLMEKEKGMIGAYDKALADPAPTKEGLKAFNKVAGQVQPEIVLMQDSDVEFCASSLKTVNEELKSPAPQLPFPSIY
jgi:hypothetical protein